MLKNILILAIGGKKFILYKSLIAIKISIINYRKIHTIIKKELCLNFFFKILISQFFIAFNPVEILEKKNINDRYSFKFPDFFTQNTNIWKKILLNIKKFNYLEIGTFEGRSALFVSELKNSEKIVCVDPYLEYDDSQKYNFKMSEVYESVNEKFNKNKNISLIKKKSDDFFLNNQEFFEVIYIDGHHQYEYVKRDFEHSINCLKKNGILICDDFLWFKYKLVEDNPIKAILECYYKHKKDLNILFISDQIIFKKIN